MSKYLQIMHKFQKKKSDIRGRGELRAELHRWCVAARGLWSPLELGITCSYAPRRAAALACERLFFLQGACEGRAPAAASVNELCHRHIRIRVQVYPPSRRSRAPSARLLAISLSAHGCAAAESRRQPVGHAYVRVVNHLSVEPCPNQTADNQLSAQSSPKSKGPKIG